MAQYTLTIKQLMENDVNIFDFDYPMFNPSYKETFQRLFIDYYFFDEIGYETVGQFKQRLKTKLNLVMPYYNKLYETQEMEQRILDNYDVIEEYKREVTGDNSRTLKGDRKNSSSGTTKNMYKDTPKTKIDIDKFDTLTNLTKVEGNNSDSNTINDLETTSNSANEKWIRTMKGNIGVQTDADAIIKYWQSLRNITVEIFENELSTLFMGVY